MSFACPACGEQMLLPAHRPEAATLDALEAGRVMLVENTPGGMTRRLLFCDREHLARWLRHPSSGEPRPKLEIVRD